MSPQFCRHNRFVQNCPICSRASEPAEPPAPRARPQRRRAGAASTDVRVRRVERAPVDEYASQLAPGLRSSADARRLADELAFAAARVDELAAEPPGLYAEVAARGDVEEACWLAFQIALLSPAEGNDAWAVVEAARVPWAGGALPRVPDGASPGPRAALGPEGGAATFAAYRRFAQRAGSQQAALAGEPEWAPQRRFARAFERLALPGLSRDARFDFLVTLGRTGRFDMRAGSLFVTSAGPDSDLALGVRRVFGIADPLLIDRRGTALAEAAEVPLEALDLALFNWQRGAEGRATLGAGAGARAGAQAARTRIAAALGV